MNTQRFSNALRSSLLVGTMALLVGSMGWLLGGTQMGLTAICVVGVLYALNPAVPPHLVVRAYRGRRIDPRSAPPLHALVRELARRAELAHVPHLYLVPGAAMNAFTVGNRERAAICVTEGLMRGLGPMETAAVLAHEIAHIGNDDVRRMGFAALSSRMTHGLSFFGQILLLVNLPLLLMGGHTVNWLAILLLVFAPTLSDLLQLALSRTREFQADLGAASLTGRPDALVSALLKIEGRRTGFWARLAWPGQVRSPDRLLLRSHPPARERVRRLMELQERRYPPPGPAAHHTPVTVWG